jgi:O-antigen/teichoic acid export membrane protein
MFGRYIIHPDYWGGLSIVPVVLLAYMFLGIYNNLVAGVYIEKKTQRLPAITLAGALVNIAANFLLIPIMGMMGGAVATLLAYAAMALVLYLDVRKFYPVRYEWRRIAHLALVAGVTYLFFCLVDAGPYHIAWKFLLLLFFCITLYVTRFFVPEEMVALRRLIHPGPRSDSH